MFNKPYLKVQATATLDWKKVKQINLNLLSGQIFNPFD